MKKQKVGFLGALVVGVLFGGCQAGEKKVTLPLAQWEQEQQRDGRIPFFDGLHKPMLWKIDGQGKVKLMDEHPENEHKQGMPTALAALDRAVSLALQPMGIETSQHSKGLWVSHWYYPKPTPLSRHRVIVMTLPWKDGQVPSVEVHAVSQKHQKGQWVGVEPDRALEAWISDSIAAHRRDPKGGEQ